MKWRMLVAVVVGSALMAALVVGCSGNQGGSSGNSSSGATGGSTVGMTIVEKGFAFTPADATVKVGETVSFENQDSATHNVQIDGKDLGQQNQGESKSWTASKAGTFPYKCTIHPSMTGVITVK